MTAALRGSHSVPPELNRAEVRRSSKPPLPPPVRRLSSVEEEALENGLEIEDDDDEFLRPLYNEPEIARRSERREGLTKPPLPRPVRRLSTEVELRAAGDIDIEEDCIVTFRSELESVWPLGRPPDRPARHHGGLAKGGSSESMDSEDFFVEHKGSGDSVDHRGSGRRKGSKGRSRRCPAVEQQPVTAAQYRPEAKIGCGSTSSVFVGVRRQDRLTVALKTMSSSSSEHSRMAHREYRLLSQARHPCIIGVYQLLQLDGHATLALEYFEGTELSLTVHAQVDRRLREHDASRLTAALGHCLEYLHRRKVVHCDLRPGNVLVSRDLGSLKLIDMGSAICPRDPSIGAFKLPEKGLHVTCAAPEVILGEDPSARSDVWQLGLCTYFMLSGALPQRRDHVRPTREGLRAVATIPSTLSSSRWLNVSEEAKVLMQCCLMINRSERPSSRNLLSHSVWLQSELIQPELAYDEEASTDGTRTPGTSSTSGGSSKTSGSSVPSLPSSADFESLPPHIIDSCSNEVIVEPQGERATILLLNYADKTCKVRMLNSGRIKLLPMEKVRRL